MPKRLLPEEVPKVVEEESESEEEESDSSDSSENESSDSDSSDNESSDDSSDSSDSSDDSSESEEEAKPAKATNGKNKVEVNGKENGKGKQKVVEDAVKGTKHKRSDEESSQTAQPDNKKVKNETNGKTNGAANGHANGKSNGIASAKAIGGPSSAAVNTWRTAHHLTVANVDDGSNNPTAPFENFSDANFPEYIMKSVKTFNFTTPTPIQAQAWPLVLNGQDIVGIAETGSGKTLAFGYPAIMHIKNKTKVVPGPKVLVLAPTRELAQQIHEVLAKACAPVGYSACVVVGGLDKRVQSTDIKKADVVVGTPGRLIDLIEDGSAQLGNVEFLVFDEADRMLDMGFIPQIRRIVERVPVKRQTLMFSATWPVDVQKFAHTYLKSPIQITIGGTNLTGAKKVTQIIEVCTRPEEKKPRLRKLLKQLTAEGNPRILIFMLYKHTCQQMHDDLLAERYNVECLHGNKAQNARERAVQSFRDGTTNILVATDVAARGLDIKDIKYVINVELPLVMEDYIHRIGRTGRAGEPGTAYTFFCPEDKQHARQLVRILEDSAQAVPKELSKIAETAPVTKPRKTAMEQMYGDFARGADADFMKKKPTKITFD
jgi:superfamily II DNA/RNA helicase